MTRLISHTSKFKKDLDKAKKQKRDIDSLKTIIELIVSEQPIPAKYRDHKLIGNYKGRRECHIEPDLLLIYCIRENEIVLERLGSHSELFKS